MDRGDEGVADKRNRRRRAAIPEESRVSLVVTVAWTVSVMTTLLCGSVAVLTWMAVRNRPDGETGLAFVQLLHFCAIVTSGLSLLLLPVMLRVRPHPPPPGFLVFAIVVSALPLVAALL